MATRLNLANLTWRDFLQEREQKGDKGNKKALWTSCCFCTLMLAPLERGAAAAAAAAAAVQCNYCRHHLHPANPPPTPHLRQKCDLQAA